MEPTASSSSDSSTSSSGSSDSSSSDSSDSDSDSDSDSIPTQSTSKPILNQQQKASQASPVVPGNGLKRTHKRNLRKRVLRIARAIEKNEKNQEGGGGAAVKENKGQVGIEGKENERVRQKGNGKGEKIVEQEKESAGEKDKMEVDSPAVPSTTTSSIPQQIFPPSSNKQAPKKPLKDPYSDYVLPPPPPPPSSSITQLPPPPFLRNGSEPGQSLVGPGRNNHPSTIYSQPQSSILGRSPLRPEPTVSSTSGKELHQKKKKKKSKGIQIDEDREKRDGNRRPSPSYAPKSPNLPSPSSFETPSESHTPSQAQSQSRSKKTSSNQYPPRFPLPNQRKDLAPWMIVTSVNVEKKGWEAGVGKRIRGTGREWIGSNWATKGEGVEEVEVDEGEGFEGWMSKEEVEGRWEGLKKVGEREGKKGIKVATKVILFYPLVLFSEFLLNS